MKFSCEKALLQSAINTASRAVSTKSSIPALEGLLLQCDHRLTVSGYNMHYFSFLFKNGTFQPEEIHL